ARARARTVADGGAQPSDPANDSTRMVPARNPRHRGHDRVRPPSRCPCGRELEPDGLRTTAVRGRRAPAPCTALASTARATSLAHLPTPLPPIDVTSTFGQALRAYC